MALSSTDMITLRNQEQPPLLRLPGELRNRIYGYALGGLSIHISFEGRQVLYAHESSRRCRVECREGPGTKWHKPQHLASLTRVCRQTRVEGRPFFFGMNQFSGNMFQMFVALPELFPDGEIRDLLKAIHICGGYESLRLDRSESTVTRLSPELFQMMEAFATGSQLQCIVVDLPWKLCKDLEERMIASWKAKFEESDTWQVLKANNVEVRVIGFSHEASWYRSCW